MLTPYPTLTLSYTVNGSSTNPSLLATVGRVQAQAAWYSKRPVHWNGKWESRWPVSGGR